MQDTSKHLIDCTQNAMATNETIIHFNPQKTFWTGHLGIKHSMVSYSFHCVLSCFHGNISSVECSLVFVLYIFTCIQVLHSPLEIYSIYYSFVSFQLLAFVYWNCLFISKYNLLFNVNLYIMFCMHCSTSCHCSIRSQDIFHVSERKESVFVLSLNRMQSTLPES